MSIILDFILSRLKLLGSCIATSLHNLIPVFRVGSDWELVILGASVVVFVAFVSVLLIDSIYNFVFKKGGGQRQKGNKK